jgi:hypothetical protein
MWGKQNEEEDEKMKKQKRKQEGKFKVKGLNKFTRGRTCKY